MLVALVISSSHADDLSPLIKTSTLGKALAYQASRHQLSLGFPTGILISRVRYPPLSRILYWHIPYLPPFLHFDLFSYTKPHHSTSALVHNEISW